MENKKHLCPLRDVEEVTAKDGVVHGISVRASPHITHNSDFYLNNKAALTSKELCRRGAGGGINYLNIHIGLTTHLISSGI